MMPMLHVQLLIFLMVEHNHKWLRIMSVPYVKRIKKLIRNLGCHYFHTQQQPLAAGYSVSSPSILTLSENCSSNLHSRFAAPFNDLESSGKYAVIKIYILLLAGKLGMISLFKTRNIFY